MHFGPLAGYDTDELDRKGLDQEKKTLRGFEWFSLMDSIVASTTPTLTIIEEEIFKYSDQDQYHKQGEHQRLKRKKSVKDLPTWYNFTQTTTFHGTSKQHSAN